MRNSNTYIFFREYELKEIFGGWGVIQKNGELSNLSNTFYANSDMWVEMIECRRPLISKLMLALPNKHCMKRKKIINQQNR